MVVRKTGGEYAIFLEAYSFHKKNTFVEMLGSMVSFLYTWTSVLVLKSSSASIVTLTCARYLIRPFFIGCDIPESSVKLLALAIISKYANLTYKCPSWASIIMIICTCMYVLIATIQCNLNYPDFTVYVYLVMFVARIHCDQVVLLLTTTQIVLTTVLQLYSTLCTCMLLCLNMKKEPCAVPAKIKSYPLPCE